jgi:hypothetical protein
VAKDKQPRISSNPFKGAGGKTPKAAHNLQPEKVPRTQSQAHLDLGERKIRFTFTDADLDGPWSLSDLAPEHIPDFFRFLRDIEGQTVNELAGPNGRQLYKEYDNFGECPNPAAPKRLAELYDSSDNICRFRLSGERRLYGLRFGHLIALLWWDPSHDIWPSRIKNT